jgi:hypothetical protein
MDELVKMVAKKTGLPDDKARAAVDVVVTYLKGKLPALVAGQIDSILKGGGSSGMGGMGDVAKNIGGMLGKK